MPGKTISLFFSLARSTFDEGHLRGYIDMFLIEQKEKRGKYFTDEDLIINCQVSVIPLLLRTYGRIL